MAIEIYYSRLSHLWTIDEDGTIAFSKEKGPFDYYDYGWVDRTCPGCDKSDSAFKVKYNKDYATGCYAMDKTFSYLASNAGSSNLDDSSEPSENETEDVFEEEVSCTSDGCETSCPMDYKAQELKSNFESQAPVAVSSSGKAPANHTSTSENIENDVQISGDDSKTDLSAIGTYSGIESSVVKSVNFDNYQNLIDNSVEDKNATKKIDNEINNESATFDGENNILLLFVTLLLSIVLII